MDKEEKTDVFTNMRQSDDFTNPDSLWEPYKRKTEEELEEEKKLKENYVGKTETSKFSDNSSAHGMITGGIFLIVIGFFVPFIGIFMVIGGVILAGIGASGLTKNQENLKLIEKEIVQEIDQDKIESLDKLLSEKLENYYYFPKGGFTEAEIMDSKLYNKKTIKSGTNMYISIQSENMIRHSLVVEYRAQSDNAPLKQVSSLYEIKHSHICDTEFYMRKKTGSLSPIGRVVKLNDMRLDMEYSSYLVNDESSLELSTQLKEVIKDLLMDYKGNIEFSYIKDRLYIKILYRDTILTKSETESIVNFNYAVHFTHQIDKIMNVFK